MTSYFFLKFCDPTSFEFLVYKNVQIKGRRRKDSDSPIASLISLKTKTVESWEKGGGC